MAKKDNAPAKTNAARLLDAAGIAYELVPYEVDENNLAADHVAEQLGEEAFSAWSATLRPEIQQDMVRTQLYWRDLRLVGVYNIQKRSYDKFLKSNHVTEGTGDYRQVLRLVLTFSDLHDHTDGEEG